jgi:hypothetical protein
MQFWKTKQFKKLQEKWYKKLKGFNDIESNEKLKQNAPNCYRQADIVERNAKLNYYLLLGEKINENKFDCYEDKLIITRIAEGYQIKDISAELKKLKKKCHRQTIRFIIRKYELRWGLKKWNQEQLKSRQMPYKKKQATR